MGAVPSAERITFEELQRLQSASDALIISTLPVAEQQCLISRTLLPAVEERTLNDCLKRGENARSIVVYGRNTTDMSVEKKHKQLSGLGFSQVRLYLGGLFEWALLQDIYGAKLFPTTSVCTDPLRFKGTPCSQLMLTAQARS
tara:strand:+ start:341 stop:769 length:429 start_codon:yes stop_codon:yes gene_type:complete